MALNFKAADKQTKLDILYVIDKVFKAAFHRNALVYGDFVRNALVPMCVNRETNDQNFVMRYMYNPDLDIDFDNICLFFPEESRLNEFVLEMGDQLIYTGKYTNNFSLYYLVKFGVKVLDVRLSSDCAFYIDIGRLGYNNHFRDPWKLIGTINDKTITSELFNLIKEKKVRLTDHYFSEIKNIKNNKISNYLTSLNNMFWSKGWTVYVGDVVFDKSTDINESDFLEKKFMPAINAASKIENKEVLESLNKLLTDLTKFKEQLEKLN